MLVRLLNTIWLLSNLPTYWRFQRAAQDPMPSQSRILMSILNKNRDTIYGKKFGFADLKCIQEFQKSVPLIDYEDIRPYIEKIKDGEVNVLTREDVQRLMPSSGSASARKLIPYNGSLQKQFDEAIGCWIADLYLNNLSLMGGKAYWSISPQDQVKKIKGKIPIGFENDTTYLGGVKQHVVDKIMAVNPRVSEINDINSFRYVTLLELLKCKDLRLISVWHPSFLTLLLDDLTVHWERLLDDIATGLVSPPSKISDELTEEFRTKPNPKRHLELSQISDFNPCLIWPYLKTVSCWGDGHASDAIKQLELRLPTIKIQPKGLIATEALMSFPFTSDKENEFLFPLAINSHFYEFVTKDNKVVTLDQLEATKEYSIVVTTGGGLYRYKMSDKIRVASSYKNIPSIEFIGKEDAVSDYYGEKLNDTFVAKIISRVLSDQGIDASFSMLAPDGGDAPTHYTLYIETATVIEQTLAERIELKLCENPHYAYCKELGQLEALRIFQIKKHADKQYILHCSKQGQTLGDIKPRKISNYASWSNVFEGKYV